MAQAVKTFSDASVDGAADQTITTLNGLPSIPAGATLSSVVLSFTCDRTGGRNDNEIRVRLGSTIHYYIQDLGRNDPRTCDITGIVRNNNGTLIYTDGSTSLNLYAYHAFKLFDNANWKLTNIKITANYTEKYTVTASSNNSNYGSVSGGGTYNAGTTVTLTATPYAGYKFVQWSDGVTSAVRAVSVTGNATYTAQFRPIYISYDSIFSFKRWADTGLKSWTLMNISNVTDTGFTGTALADDAYTENSTPVMNVTAGKSYTVDFNAYYPPGFQLFVFSTDANGNWDGSVNNLALVANATRLTFTPTTNYIVIRCDIDGTGNVNTFSDFRIYPVEYPYMSNSVSATERTGRGGQAMPTPTRVGYTFTGWNTRPDGTGTTYTASNLPTDDIILYSQWTVKTFKVTFKDENGYVLKTETVNYNSTVTAPTDPVKDDTAQHKYTFDGWYDANGNKWYPNTAITGDTIYTARFNSTVQRYTVKWYNEDGSVLLETDELVPYGDKPDYNGATPTKAETAAATYEHIGWSIDVNSSGTTELTAVIEAVNYYARFRAINKTYTVVWKNDDGTVLETDTAVAYGAIPDYNGSTPTKDDEQFVYTFLGWSANVEDPPLDDTELPTVTGNITYTAVYEKTPKHFMIFVDFLNNKGELLGGYMKISEYGREIGIEADEIEGYRFVKWSDGNTDNPRNITVTAEVTYQAIYERVPVPIIVNEEQRVTGVYIVPATQTIVYVVSGEVPAVVANGVTVDDLSFRVSNSVPDNSYPIEKLFINETRVY